MTTLRLNAADLSRTVLRSAPAVLLELGMAGQRLFRADVPEHLAGWRARTRAALRPQMRPYLDLCRVPDRYPDLLTPPRLGSDLDGSLDEVAASPDAAFAAELGPLVESGALPDRLAPLAAGEAGARARLRAAMTAFHEVAVAPYWAEITATVRADRAVRGHALLDAGIDRVLRDLSPYLTWSSTGDRYALSYRCAVADDLELVPGGRGVTLLPSYFAPQPYVLDDPAGPLVLAYPVRPGRRELTAGKPLADLLGRTRAAVLAAIVDAPSTSRLAEVVGVSVASASQHAAVLRAAGLITTHRAGPAVRHLLTPLGEQLLREGRPVGVSPR
ncbi:winged helix-turn-helix domain-containing protein [Micromonospora sp. PLK6-60]|uniref:ArsR/SmtB family transcription factor n=1 Tax=Micromonospora sp. PLK6-60 TaxID=2873383 RepID=UPI001CA796BD|nr:winged helix-turn-helix domain-containing protein [Micromonospora sp. PLK6-60]MBY8870912.1 winged helix-turn-helix domain-containing protein [Micromonospora sp. PLK6-60]